MAKQDDYVRTQVRLDIDTHTLLKEYCEKNNVSMNYAINSLLYDTLIESMFNEDNALNRELYIGIMQKRLNTLSLEEIKKFCSLVVHMSQLKGH